MFFKDLPFLEKHLCLFFKKELKERKSSKKNENK